MQAHKLDERGGIRVPCLLLSLVRSDLRFLWLLINTGHSVPLLEPGEVFLSLLLRASSFAQQGCVFCYPGSIHYHSQLRQIFSESSWFSDEGGAFKVEGKSASV